MATASGAPPAHAPALPSWATPEQVIALAQPTLTVRGLQAAVPQVLPRGGIGLRALLWRRLAVPGVGNMIAAILPQDREGDLRAGAAAEAGTTPFPVKNAGVGKPKRFCCPRAAPRRKPPPKAPVPGEPATRGVAQQRGEDKRPFHTDCKVAYTVGALDGGRIMVKVSDYDALEHNHDTNTAARYVPRWVRDAVKAEFLASGGKRLNAQNIAAKINADAEDMALLSDGFEHIDDAINAWLKGTAQPSREAFVNATYVQDLLRRLHRDADEVVYNHEEAIAEWVDSVGDDVFFYSPGQVVERGAKEDVRPWGCYNTATIPLQY